MGYFTFLKNHPRIAIAIASALILGVVAGTTFYFTAEYGNVGPNEKIYSDTNRNHRPLLNPNPRYYLTIVVTGDAELLKRLQLHFLVQYYAANLKCMEPVPWTFGTAHYSPDVTHMQWARKQQKLPYVFVFALDRYQRGVCDWRAGGLLSFDASDKSGESPKEKASSVLGFKYENFALLKSQAGGTVICDKKLVCNTPKDFAYFGSDMPLGSYTYFLHFIKKQEN